MAESGLTTCTFCLLSPVGPLTRLVMQREGAEAASAEKEPERAMVGVWGAYLQTFRFCRANAAT